MEYANWDGELPMPNAYVLLPLTPMPMLVPMPAELLGRWESMTHFAGVLVDLQDGTECTAMELYTGPHKTAIVYTHAHEWAEYCGLAWVADGPPDWGNADWWASLKQVPAEWLVDNGG